MSKITIDEFHAIGKRSLSFMEMMGIRLEGIGDGEVTARAHFDESFLRPGGTVSGPIMMGLADAAMYALVLSLVGPVELAVTTNLNINFLQKPLPGDVIAVAKILKLGKRLAIGEIYLYSDASDQTDPVAHVTSTYSIPPIK